MATISGITSSEIADKYMLADNTFIKAADIDDYKSCEIEIGDSKQPDIFYPQMKLKFWENEVNFSARLTQSEINSIVSTDDNMIVWAGEKIESKFYDIKNEKYPDGAYEFEIWLKEKPKSNILIFTIQTKGLNFFYQPPLTEDQVKRGLNRPDNVIGSYAVYHSSKRDNLINSNGKLIEEYRTGKAFHIYRPEIIDSIGNKIWGELNVDVDNEFLTITIDERFLTDAIYPILVDPTFGNGGTPASSADYNYNDPTYWLRASPASNGTISSISVYGKYHTSSGAQVCPAIYSDNTDNTPLTKLASIDSGGTAFGASAGYVTTNISLSVLAGTYYWLCEKSGINDKYYDFYFDTGTGATFYWGTGGQQATWPTTSDFTTPSEDDLPGIYATYTASGNAFTGSGPLRVSPNFNRKLTARRTYTATYMEWIKQSIKDWRMLCGYLRNFLITKEIKNVQNVFSVEKYPVL